MLKNAANWIMSYDSKQIVAFLHSIGFIGVKMRNGKIAYSSELTLQEASLDGLFIVLHKVIEPECSGSALGAGWNWLKRALGFVWVKCKRIPRADNSPRFSPTSPRRSCSRLGV